MNTNYVLQRMKSYIHWEYPLPCRDPHNSFAQEQKKAHRDLIINHYKEQDHPTYTLDKNKVLSPISEIGISPDIPCEIHKFTIYDKTITIIEIGYQ